MITLLTITPMGDSDSWEEVTNIEAIKAKKMTRKVKRFMLLNKTIWVLKRIKNVNLECEIKGIDNKQNNFNKYKLVENYVAKEDLDGISSNILIFKYCLRYRIPIRIGFVLEKDIAAFLELCLAKSVSLHKKTYSSEVVGIDHLLGLTDMTFLYSKKTSRLHLNETLKKLVKDIILGSASDETESAFSAEDTARITKIPSSISKMKSHPIYTVESLLSNKRFVFPKRPVYGYFKGEPVYDKKKVQKLHTERQLYYKGKKVKENSKPYRIASGNKLYAHWQTENIAISLLNNNNFMDYFHPNFLPSGCFYSNLLFSETISQVLGIEHRRCITGFVNRTPATEGVFVEKKNAYIYFNFLKEYSFYTNLLYNNQKGLRVIRLWERLIARVKRYLEIRNRIG